MGLCNSTPAVKDSANQQVTYTIKVTTGNVKGAGTDSSVRIVLHGSNGSSEILPLDNRGKNDFESGNTDSFSFTINSIGQLLWIDISSSDSGALSCKPGLHHLFFCFAGLESDWNLLQVTVHASDTDETVRFPYYGWLCQEDKRLTLWPSSAELPQHASAAAK